MIFQDDRIDLNLCYAYVDDLYQLPPAVVMSIPLAHPVLVSMPSS